jgi:hypothetical protein
LRIFVAGLGANLEHFFYGALANQEPAKVIPAQNDGHSPSNKIERDFIQLEISLGHLFQRLLLSSLDNRFVEQVFQSRLEKAV